MLVVLCVSLGCGIGSIRMVCSTRSSSSVWYQVPGAANNRIIGYELERIPAW
jgi:hypothetical protein